MTTRKRASAYKQLANREKHRRYKEKGTEQYQPRGSGKRCQAVIWDDGQLLQCLRDEHVDMYHHYRRIPT